MVFERMIEAIIQGAVSIIVVTIPVIVSAIKNKRSIESRLDEHIKSDEWFQAKSRRARIMCFYDEICIGIRHSENSFDEILEAIDDYEKWCRENPEFPNNKGVIAMRTIKDTYEKAKKKNDFLIYEGRE